MKINIHRGTHEIGGSCIELKHQDTRIIIDIGIPLVKSDGERFNIRDHDGLRGPDLVKGKILPDIEDFYKWDAKSKLIDALFISHAHIDHYGFYNYVRNDIHYYLGKGSKKLIDLTTLIMESDGHIERYTYLKSGIPNIVGPFTVTPYLMDHSAFDAYAFLVEAGGKRLIYSGDFREHGRKTKAFYWFLSHAPQDVDALLLEGTLIEGSRKTQKTEKVIEDEIVEAINDSPSIVFVVQSSQNIDRVVSFYKAASRTKRMFLMDVYTANVVDMLKDTAKLPYPSKTFDNIRVFYPYRISDKLVKMGNAEMLYKFKSFKINKVQIAGNKSKIVMMIRPSMINELSKLEDLTGATVIYSMWDGYLKEKSMETLLKFVERNNINMVHIHTSGHANVETLKKVVVQLKPKAVIPIHTFYPDRYDKIFPNILKFSDGVEFDL